MQVLTMTLAFMFVAMVALLLRGTLANLDKAPLGWRLAVGCGVGVLFSLPVIIREFNIVPDALEPAALAVLLAALVVGFLALALQELRRQG